MHVDGSGRDPGGVKPPDLGEDLLARDHPLRMAGEVEEELILPLGEVGPLPILEPDLARSRSARPPRISIRRATGGRPGDRRKTASTPPGARGY